MVSEERVEHSIEGYMFEHRDRSLWVVKGCYQPCGGLIAVPKFHDNFKFKKYVDAYAHILRYYRHYMRFVNEIGREVPLVPLNDVLRLINPLEVVYELKELRAKGIVRAALELLEIIVDGCSCSAGLSGSLAGGYFTDSSDIDIVVYSRLHACYDLLRRLRREGVLAPLNYGQAYAELLETYEDMDKRFADLMRTRVLQVHYKVG